MNRFASAPRLSTQTLSLAQGADMPRYRRLSNGRLVHLGLGAFARAHLATYADDLLAMGWPAGIQAISLRSPRAEQLLAPQDYLYTVAEADGSSRRRHRVIASLVSARTGAHAAIAAIADPNAALVTVTVTEKGYSSVAQGSDIQVGPLSAPAVIAHALQARRRVDAGPLVIAPLDNVLDNGKVLRDAVISVAAELDASLPEWIDDEIRFASSIVDRIVPATTQDDVDEVTRSLKLLDLATVVAEPHRSWFIADVPGLPPLADVGVCVVGDLGPYERRKLWLLNGPHSAFAYCGLLAGKATIAEASADQEIHEFVKTLAGQAVEVADLPSSADGPEFAAEAIRRFGNIELGHTCAQVAADGSQKLPQRLMPVVVARIARGLPTSRFAFVVAAWMVSVAGVPVQGRVVPAADDPAAAALRAAYDEGGERALVSVGLGNNSPPGFATEVCRALGRITREGMRALQEAA